MRSVTNKEKIRIHIKGENHLESIPYQLDGQDFRYGKCEHCASLTIIRIYVHT